MSIYPLNLSYDQFLKNKKSIVDTKFHNYIVFQLLGKGAFGSVYLGMNVKTKKQVAIKLLDLMAIEKQDQSKQRQDIMRRLAKNESQTMMKINSNHVMKLFDVFQNKQLKIMVVEYCNGGTLIQQIYKSGGRIPEQQAIQILKQIMIGLADMHQLNIIHRDLKTQNIMSHNGIYKIIDLGFAKILPQNTENVGTVLGTPISMAPEVMKRMKYGLKADIWSIGIILYEMLSGQVPYIGHNLQTIYNQIEKKNIFPNDCFLNGVKPSGQMLDLLKKLLVVDSTKRLSWSELIDQKIFKPKHKLYNEYRYTSNIDSLQWIKKLNIGEIDQVQLLNYIFQNKEAPLQIFINNGGVVITKLSQSEKKQKQNLINNANSAQQHIIKQAKKNHLQCLKTEFIYKQIIQPIEQKNMLNLNDRTVIQFMYLLASRCFMNMSVILNDDVNSQNLYVISLKNMMQQTYKIVEKVFIKYSELLTIQQNKISSMIGDSFTKMFQKDKIKTKDIFLTGLENVQYKKEEQIVYTYENYITKVINQLKNKENRIVAVLKNYKKINDLQVNDLDQMKFHERVNEIIKDT